MASRRRLLQRFAFASHAVHHQPPPPGPGGLEGRVVLSTFTVNSVGDSPTGSVPTTRATCGTASPGQRR